MRKQSHIKINQTGEFLAEFPGCRVISDQNINLTEAQANQFLEYESFAGERAVRQGHVQHLHDEWRAGRFLWNMVTIVVGTMYEKNGDGPAVKRTFRLNGQHTCWMRTLVNEKNMPACKVRHLIYECENMDGIRAIYSSIDRGAGRSSGHIAKVLMVDAATASGIPVSYITKLTTGFALWQWEDRAERRRFGTPSEITNLLTEKYPDLFRAVGGFYQNHITKWKHLARASIVAALFATFNKAPKEAAEFWSSVVEGINFTRREDPRWQLRNWCENHGVETHGSEKEATTAEELFRVSINLWNKWRRSDIVNVVRSTDERVKPL